jgi:hypothetical protein
MTGLTGVQREVSERSFRAAAGGVLSTEMSDTEMVRAAARAIPVEKRAEVLAMLKALVGSNTTDTLTGSYNA